MGGDSESSWLGKRHPVSYFWRLVGIVILAMSWVGAGSMALLVTDNQPPLQYVSARAIEKEVAQGGELNVEYEVFRSKICESTVRRYVVDAAGEQWSVTNYTVGSNLKAGKEVYQRKITVPLGTALGVATYEVKLEYRCNIMQVWLWPLKVNAPPIPFLITAGDPRK